MVVVIVVAVFAFSGGGDETPDADVTPTPDATPSRPDATPTATASPTPAVPPTPTPLPNLPPRLSPIGDLSAPLGRTLRLQLEAIDPDGDVVLFSASPLPLIANGFLNSMTGEFAFTPKGGQVGEFELTFVATDEFGGAGKETVTITVPAPRPGAPTALTGRILDANSAVLGQDVPISGAVVSLLGTGITAMTGPDGAFGLDSVPSGNVVFDIDVSGAQNASDGSPYAGFREALNLIGGVENQIERPFYLPRIAVNSLTQVDPSQTTRVVNDDLGITVTVPPNTAKLADGSNFAGQLSISLVPEALAPAALPEFLEPGLLITLQPVGVSYLTPVPITFPNTDDLPPGSISDIWSLDPEAGAFVVVGKTQVSDDGESMVTIEGGIIANDWHATVPPPPIIEDDPADDENRTCGCDRSEVPLGSNVSPHTGNVSETYMLPPYESLGADRQLEFTYNSLDASPLPVISGNATIGATGALPLTSSVTLEVGGVALPGAASVATDGLRETVDETIVQALPFKATGFQTGVYPYRMRVSNNYPASSISSTARGDVIVRNLETSPLGAGWSIKGIDRLHLQDHAAVLSEGDGGVKVYRVAPPALLSEDFEDGASPLWTTDKTSSLDSIGGVFGNFSGETVSISFTDMPPHSGVELHFDFIAFDSWDGTNANFGVDRFKIGTGESLDSLFDEAFEFFGRSSDLQDQTYTVTEPENQGGDLGFNAGFPDAVYRDLNNGFIFDHSSNTLTLNFTDTSTQGLNDESWGLDNFTIQLIGVPDTVPVYLTPVGDFSTLIQNPDGTFVRTLKDRTLVYFDEVGRQTGVEDTNGNMTSYSYDFGGNLVEVKDPAGMVTDLQYSEGRLSRVTDPAGRSTIFNHDSRGNLVSITAPDGAVQSFDYNGSHRLTSKTSPSGSTTRFRYDSNGRYASTAFPDGTAGAAISMQSRSISMPRPAGQPSDPVLTEDLDGIFTDGNGNESRFVTNAFGSIVGVEDSIGPRSTVVRDKQNNNTAETAPLGTVTNYEYDGMGNVTRIISDSGGASEAVADIEYDPVFNIPNRIVDELGRIRLFEIDSETGNVLSERVVVGEPDTVAAETDDRVTRFDYDARGLLITETDPEGVVNRLSYDSAGRVASVTTASGTSSERIIRYTYDAAGNLMSSADGNGGTTRFERDEVGRLLAVIEPGSGGSAGPRTRFEYDADGNLLSETDPLGNTILYGYDELDRVVQITDAADGVIRNQYDDAGNLSTVTDPLGRVTRFEYDARNRLVSVTDAAGGKVVDTYDDNGNVVSTTDQLGNVTRTEYDELDRVTKITDPLGNATTFTYDEAGNLAASANPLGNVTRFEYDEEDRLVKTIDALGNAEVSVYDDAGNLIEFIDAAGNKTTRQYDGLNRLVSETDPPGNTTRFEYDDNDNVIRTTDPNGGVTTFTYDSLDRLVSTTTPTGASERFEYDDNGNETAFIDAEGNRTEFTYDSLNRLITERNPLGNTTRYEYDAIDNLVGVTDANGNTFRYEFDELGRQVVVIDPTGARVVTEYDAAGNIISETDALGNVTRFTYDAANRVISETDSQGGVLRYEYDAAGSVVRQTDEAGRVTQFTYDALNRITQVRDAGGGTTRTTYDANGNVLTATDPEGNVTRFTYDSNNRQLQETDPRNNTTRFEYDANGNLTKETKPDGRVLEFRFNGEDRIVEEKWLDGQGGTVRRIRFEYNANGSLTGIEDPVSDHTIEYDAAERISRHSSGGGSAPSQMFEYAYDAAGNRTRITDRVNGRDTTITEFKYDSRDLVAAISQSGPGVASKSVVLNYNGNRLRTLAEGRTGTSTTGVPSLATAWTYDSIDRTVGTSYSGGGSSLPHSRQLTYDATGNVASVSTAVDTVTYSYDELSQLTNAGHSDGGITDESYLYNDAGNRISSHVQGASYAIENGNLLARDHNFTYAYDSNGNLIRTVRFADASRRTFSYDHRDRLIEVADRPSVNAPVSQLVTYEYDALGRRAMRTVDADGEGSGPPVTTYFIHENHNVWLEFEFTGEQPDPTSAASSVRYFTSGLLDDLLAVEDLDGGNVFWVMPDHQGSTVGLTDGGGNVVSTFAYDSYGNVIDQTGPVPGAAIRFGGRELEESTGLYFLRARFYDPVAGRFISADPADILETGPNSYTYAENNPATLIDPFGLKPPKLTKRQKQIIKKIDSAIKKLEKRRDELKRSISREGRMVSLCKAEADRVHGLIRARAENSRPFFIPGATKQNVGKGALFSGGKYLGTKGGEAFVEKVGAPKILLNKAGNAAKVTEVLGRASTKVGKAGKAVGGAATVAPAVVSLGFDIAIAVEEGQALLNECDANRKAQYCHASLKRDLEKKLKEIEKKLEKLRLKRKQKMSQFTIKSALKNFPDLLPEVEADPQKSKADFQREYEEGRRKRQGRSRR